MSMQFCQQCSNLMYPTSREGTLIFVCKVCPYTVAVEQPLVWKQTLIQTESDTLQLPNKNIILDPTLPRDDKLKCRQCGQPEPAYFQPSEESMALIYACRNQSCTKMGPLSEFDPFTM